jgi:hypothetical protein
VLLVGLDGEVVPGPAVAGTTATTNPILINSLRQQIATTTPDRPPVCGGLKPFPSSDQASMPGIAVVAQSLVLIIAPVTTSTAPHEWNATGFHGGCAADVRTSHLWMVSCSDELMAWPTWSVERGPWCT